MKKRLYYIIHDGGDGSSSVEFFNSQAELDACLKEKEENDDYEIIVDQNNSYYEDIDTDLLEDVKVE